MLDQGHWLFYCNRKGNTYWTETAFSFRKVSHSSSAFPKVNRQIWIMFPYSNMLLYTYTLKILCNFTALKLKKNEQIVNKRITFAILINILILNSKLHTFYWNRNCSFCFIMSVQSKHLRILLCLFFKKKNVGFLPPKEKIFSMERKRLRDHTKTFCPKMLATASCNLTAIRIVVQLPSLISVACSLSSKSIVSFICNAHKWFFKK